MSSNHLYGCFVLFKPQLISLMETYFILILKKNVRPVKLIECLKNSGSFCKSVFYFYVYDKNYKLVSHNDRETLGSSINWNVIFPSK